MKERIMTKIKICGLKREEDIEYVNELQPDYIGFVFAKSKRQIDLKTAFGLKEGLHPDIQAVGVFVDEEIFHITKLCGEHVIDVIQLHGNENTGYIAMLKRCLREQQLGHIPIIKAVRMKDKNNALKEYASVSCDYILLDTYVEGQYGGSGKVFHHANIPPLQKPFFLAGGLGTENVCRAIMTAHPYAVDISSGVEINGVKSYDKIKTIIESIRDLER